ncbi:MAG: molybdopterin-dependent oxidoreductase [Verrucomicrobiales bacterium]|nr:molybdopterin-dependent oxidoreductase [Verrucomicrobiales bacterium]
MKEEDENASSGDSNPQITPFPLESTEAAGVRIETAEGEDPFEVGEDSTFGPVRTEGEDLVVSLLLSPHAAASIARKNGAAARDIEGVEAVLFSEDLGRKKNRLNPRRPDDAILAEDEVTYCGQPVAIIVACDDATCREARNQIEIDYHPAPGILSVEHAMAMQSFHDGERVIQRGNATEVLDSTHADQILDGTFSITGQLPGTRPPGVRVNYRPGDRGITLELRTESPGIVRSAVAAALDLPESEVTVEPHPLENNGAAREMETAFISVIAALAASRCRWSTRLRLDSTENALLMGRRHGVHATFKAAFDRESGCIRAADIRFAMNGGPAVEDSDTILDRALLHADGCYHIADFCARGILCKTSTATCSTLPGEGTAQGIWVMEEMISRIAAHLDLPAETVREANFYRDSGTNNTTHYGQTVTGAAIQRVWKQALRRSSFDERRAAIHKWNQSNASFKRGIGVIPLKMGIGDPRSDRNFGTAQIQIFPDGSIRVYPGYVETFDGLTSQIQNEVSASFGIEREDVHVSPGNPQTTPLMTNRIGVDTTGLILKAVADAGENLKEQLRTVALQMLASRGNIEIELEAIQFENGCAGVGNNPESNRTLTFSELIDGAIRRRINLTGVGFYRAPNLWWDPEVGAGWPFSSYSYGAAVVEIQIDAFTGEIDVMQLDLVHEGSPAPDQSDRDEAQIMRAFAQGQGWLLSEPFLFSDDARANMTIGEEGIPGISDAPLAIEIDRLRPNGELSVAPGAPCAEAPLVLALAAREAIRDAILSFAGKNAGKLTIDLPFPSGPPEVLKTLREVSHQLAEIAKAKRYEKESKAVPNTRGPEQKNAG